ncbi:hypothetical protein BC833DRAFT_566464 [Globomyces pollinis-pini]|nr:hypothetical protein BC833DRAFT_566464 [Globomyces pollinis-pini]
MKSMRIIFFYVSNCLSVLLLLAAICLDVTGKPKRHRISSYTLLLMALAMYHTTEIAMGTFMDTMEEMDLLESTNLISIYYIVNQMGSVLCTLFFYHTIIKYWLALFAILPDSVLLKTLKDKLSGATYLLNIYLGGLLIMFIFGYTIPSWLFHDNYTMQFFNRQILYAVFLSIVGLCLLPALIDLPFGFATYSQLKKSWKLDNMSMIIIRIGIMILITYCFIIASIYSHLVVIQDWMFFGIPNSSTIPTPTFTDNTHLFLGSTGTLLVLLIMTKYIINLKSYGIQTTFEKTPPARTNSSDCNSNQIEKPAIGISATLAIVLFAKLILGQSNYCLSSNKVSITTDNCLVDITTSNRLG